MANSHNKLYSKPNKALILHKLIYQKKFSTMSFLENEDVLDRLSVQYNQEGFPDSITDAYDDASFDEAYDDSNDDSAEFFPIPGMGGLISKGINAVSGLLNRGTNTSVNLSGVRPGNVSTAGLGALSNLVGSVTNSSGRQYQIRVPGAATNDSIAKIKQALDAQNANIKKVSDTVNKNAAETAKIATEINRVDSKHTAASKAQNKVLDRLNEQSSRTGKHINQLGRQVGKLQKDLKDSQSQAQMMALMPLLMNNEPKITNMTFGSAPTANNLTVPVTNSTFDSGDDNTFLIMAMMMGGFGGGSGGGNDMMPLTMLLLLK
jgi:uncharacterized coiled-coil protein SlyX